MIASEPAGKDDVVQVATPLPFTEATVQPAIAVPFCVKATDPTGVPTPGATTATVAVKVTDWLYVEGETGSAVTVVVVAAPFTVYPRVPLLAVKFVFGV